MSVLHLSLNLFLLLMIDLHVHLSLRRDPYESSLSQWLFDGGAYYRIPYTPCTDPSWSGPLPTGNWDVAWKPPFLSIFTFGVSRPEASTPCLDVPPPWPLTREPIETSPCPAELSSGPSLRGSTLTLVNARVRWPVGTQAPQSWAVNLFSEETMASPYRPTWLPVTGRVQCIEVTLSCSCCNQRTRVLIRRLWLNVACASQVYVKSFENARFMHCSITWNFSRTLHVLPRALWFPFLAKPKTFAHQQSKVWFFSIDCSLLLFAHW